MQLFEKPILLLPMIATSLLFSASLPRPLSDSMHELPSSATFEIKEQGISFSFIKEQAQPNQGEGSRPSIVTSGSVCAKAATTAMLSCWYSK